MTRGGARENTGRKLGIPAGDGLKIRTTVALGDEVWDDLKGLWPGYSEQDIIRAVALEATGKVVLPLQHARAQFTEAEAQEYAALLDVFFDAGLDIEAVGGSEAPLGVRLELAYRELAENPQVGKAAGGKAMTALLDAQFVARQRRIEDGMKYRERTL